MSQIVICLENSGRVRGKLISGNPRSLAVNPLCGLCGKKIRLVGSLAPPFCGWIESVPTVFIRGDQDGTHGVTRPAFRIFRVVIRQSFCAYRTFCGGKSIHFNVQ
jgi:hypothetical protein